jgi:hypothetical protein
MSPTAVATLSRPSTTTPELPAARSPTPTVPPADTTHWTITTTEGVTVTGHQPSWSLEDPSQTGLPLDNLLRQLRDIRHFANFHTPPFLPTADGEPGPDNPYGITINDGIFMITIECHPYDDEPAYRTPTAGLHITEGCWFDSLQDSDLARFATQLRAQADHLDQEVHPTLVAARTDWATKNGIDTDSTNSPTAPRLVTLPAGGTP